MSVLIILVHRSTTAERRINSTGKCRSLRFGRDGLPVDIDCSEESLRDKRVYDLRQFGPPGLEGIRRA